MYDIQFTGEGEFFESVLRNTIKSTYDESKTRFEKQMFSLFTLIKPNNFFNFT